MVLARDHDPRGRARLSGDASDGLPMLAQDTLKQDPSSGNLFVFRGKRGALVKLLTGDGQGFTETGGLLSYPCG
ncbi:MAG: IS66 family insertion sequence element accessory protein TnpB [Hyphomicrobiaceae bacterium]